VSHPLIVSASITDANPTASDFMWIPHRMS
jgi:hypothetical protein